MIKNSLRNWKDKKIIQLSYWFYFGFAILIASIRYTIIGETLNGTSGVTPWRITHFLLYLVAGYIYPHKLVLFTSFGILWEFLEYLLRSCFTDPYWGEGWDYTQDIIANVSGFITGAIIFTLRQRILKKSVNPKSLKSSKIISPKKTISSPSINKDKKSFIWKSNSQNSKRVGLVEQSFLESDLEDERKDNNLYIGA